MYRWKLKVEGYGKIRSATIEMKPFLAFVGDNNSGKSYLLSLIWGIFTIGRRNLYHNADVLQTPEWEKCRTWLVSAYEAEEELDLDIKGHRTLINTVLNQLVELNKDNFVRELFNFDGMAIKKLEIELSEEIKLELHTVRENDKKWLEAETEYNLYKTRRTDDKADASHLFGFIIRAWLCGEAFTPFDKPVYDEEIAYLPAARTGFMLTKDIINRVGRNQTFNYVSSGNSGKSVMNEEIDDAEAFPVQPFVRPINHFLNIMTELSADKIGEHKDLVQFIEANMTKGKIDFSSLPGKEVRYRPNGVQEDMPLRIASAVVTEISPLALLLAHKPDLKGIFYEEPEMCLHPQLQQQMGRLLIRMVNQELPIVITTHSDIILQHINNMIKLDSLKNKQELQSNFGYEEADLLSADQIGLYQLQDQGMYSDVSELTAGRYGFEVPTFNDALDKLLEEVYSFQPEEDETDE